MPDADPLVEIDDGVAWYFEGAEGASKSKHEGPIVVYPGWVRLGGLTIPTWVPRDRVEQVHER